MSQIVVRSYRPEDRASVRRICHETAMMGASIAPQYRDLESFADMFSGYFTDCEPGGVFVAELAGQVVGYALAAVDARRAWDPMRVALRHVLTRGVCFRPGTFGFYLRALGDMIAHIGKATRPPVAAQYQSTAHVNLLPAARSAHAGKELLFRAFDYMVERESPGVFGESFTANTVTIKFWQKTLGLTVLDGAYPVPGIRGVSGEKLEACIGVRTLDTWRIGWWRELPEFTSQGAARRRAHQLRASAAKT